MDHRDEVILMAGMCVVLAAQQEWRERRKLKMWLAFWYAAFVWVLAAVGLDVANNNAIGLALNLVC